MMAERAVSRRPTMDGQAGNKEVDIASLVREGGSSAATEAERKAMAKRKRQEKKASEPVVNVRIPVDLLKEVDRLRSARAGKVSRNTWIVMAIEDQVERMRKSERTL